MPNLFAHIILIAWPIISLFFFRRMSVVPATFWTIIGGYLLLPVYTEIDLPLIPPLGKEELPVIASLVGCIFVKNIHINLLPKSTIERWLIIILIVSPFFTMINNLEVVNFIPGLTLHDAFSASLNLYLEILPFIIGMSIIKTYEDQVLLFKLLVIAGIIYSLPTLFEIRMSPQLHTWIYGYFPHVFYQQIRLGGFRPVVFLGHGLLVSMFIAVVVGSVVILIKQKYKLYIIPNIVFLVYFLVVLLLSKSLAAAIFGLTLIVFIAWSPPGLIRRGAFLLGFLAVLYPFLSILDLFPHDELVRIASDYDFKRGQSLEFRFFHEGLLLEHAQNKLFFGWGGWGRWRLEDSITDGFWIITLSQFGIIGFFAIFGLLFITIIKASKSSRLLNNKMEIHLVLAHSFIVSIIMIDQIPNASISAMYYFYIGALCGRANQILETHSQERNKKLARVAT